jgi:hypothetical protein
MIIRILRSPLLRRHIAQGSRLLVNSLAQFLIAHAIEFARLAALGSLNALAG